MTSPDQPAAGTAGTAGSITVNGDRHPLAPGATVASLLRDLGTEPRGVAVAVDGEVVVRRTWDERRLAPGEHVEILSIAQGG